MANLKAKVKTTGKLKGKSQSQREIVAQNVTVGQFDIALSDLADVDTEKDVDIIMSRYRLWGDDYADSFRATEATLINALTEAEREEDEDGVEQNIKTYKMILQIPFTTEKN